MGVPIAVADDTPDCEYLDQNDLLAVLDETPLDVRSEGTAIRIDGGIVVETSAPRLLCRLGMSVRSTRLLIWYVQIDNPESGEIDQIGFWRFENKTERDQMITSLGSAGTDIGQIHWYIFGNELVMIKKMIQG